jgi:hypothetical protein
LGPRLSGIGIERIKPSNPQHDRRHIPISLAELYAFRRESDKAMKWLDVAYEQRDSNLYLLKVSWELKSLDGDPRYKAYLKKINLPYD